MERPMMKARPSAYGRKRLAGAVVAARDTYGKKRFAQALL